MKRSFAALVEELLPLHGPEHPLLVGVDGPGGSGKSMFATALVRAFEGAGAPVAVVQTDDFYLPALQRGRSTREVGSDFDGRALEAVVAALRAGRSPRYRRYDWARDEPAEWHDVPLGRPVIVEGIYSTRDELFANYDYCVWLDCPRNVRLERGLKRDGERARELWERDWMPREDDYVSRQHPQRRAHLRVDGSGSVAADGTTEFVVSKRTI